MNQAQKRSLIVIAAVSMLAAARAKKNVATAPPPAPVATPAAAANPAPAPVHTAASQPPAATTLAPRYPDAATRARIDQLLAKIEDAYFDYNRATLRPDAVPPLHADSTELRWTS